MHIHCPKNIGRAVQTDLTLLCYALVIMKQKRGWELLGQKFDQFQKLCNKQDATSCNNVQQGVQTDTTCNIQQCCICLPRALRKKISTLGFLTQRVLTAGRYRVT